MRSTKREIGLIIGTSLIVVSVIGVYGFVQYRSNTDLQRLPNSPINTEQSASKERTSTVQSNDVSVLQVQGSSTNEPTRDPLATQQPLVQSPKQSEKSQSPQLPDPSNFEVYEKYIDQQQTLYAEIAIGDGEEIKSGDTISVTYQGWLTDGQLFDRSRVNEEGVIEPFTFKLGSQQVIRGWEEGITGMKIGGKRRLIIPPASGYGSTGTGPIPPNAMLIFDVYVAYLQPAQP